MVDIEFRVRYVTGTGTIHWCPNADGVDTAAGEICDGKTLTGASKETKTKFNSETSPQWTLTIPCDEADGTPVNRTISRVQSDTKIVVHDTFDANNNKVKYCIGNIPSLGRVTNPQGHTKVYGDDDARFLEQLKVGYDVTIGNLRRTITSITSNSEMTVNTAFTGGVNSKSQMQFHGKYGTGEVSTSAGSTDVIGTLDVTQTKFSEELAVGYLLMVGKDYKVITGIDSATKLSVDLPFTTMTNTESNQAHGYYKNSFNYESCFTYDIGDFAEQTEYTTKHVYVEDACEIKPGCCGFKISSSVWPDKWAYYKIRPAHSNLNIRVVATTIEDNIDLVAKKDAVPTTSSYDYTSVRESNPWALSIPYTAITCGESYVGYNVSTSLGTQAHITNPSAGVVDDSSTLDADAVDLSTDSSYAPSNCSFFYIGVRGDNRYPQKTGASEYNLTVYTEFEFPNFLCSDSGALDTSDCTADHPSSACIHLGLTVVEDAAFLLNTEDSRSVMRLTPNSNMRKGAMYYSTKVHLFDGFETTFTFRISHFTVGCNSVLYPSGTCGGGDGFAFLIHEELDGDTNIGCHGAGMGFATVSRDDQGNDWARARCIAFDLASAFRADGTDGTYLSTVDAGVGARGQPGCDSGLASDKGSGTGKPNWNEATKVHNDDGHFGEACALGALCTIDAQGRHGCGDQNGMCGYPSCTKAIGRLVAIEFDTWNNLNLHDPKQGVSRWWINATDFVGYNPNHVADTPSIPNLADGQIHEVKIKYWP